MPDPPPPAKRFNRTPARKASTGNLWNRLAEQTPAEEATGLSGVAAKDATKGKKSFPLPERPPGRATLVERDNPEEYLEFHWDPTTIDISKSARWSSGPVTGGTDIQEWNGTGLTNVSFEMFLNDIANPHETQRTVEESLEWLYNRLRSRDKQLKTAQGRQPQVGRWLSVHDAKAGIAPPILVFFGLSHGFECTLTRASTKTQFQRPFSQTTMNRSAITRCTVSITLQEYVKAPG